MHITVGYLDDLLKAVLRHRPDPIIASEVRGPEAAARLRKRSKQMFVADLISLSISSGNRGSVGLDKYSICSYSVLPLRSS